MSEKVKSFMGKFRDIFRGSFAGSLSFQSRKELFNFAHYVKDSLHHKHVPV